MGKGREQRGNGGASSHPHPHHTQLLVIFLGVGARTWYLISYVQMILCSLEGFETGLECPNPRCDA